MEFNMSFRGLFCKCLYSGETGIIDVFYLDKTFYLETEEKNLKEKDVRQIAYQALEARLKPGSDLDKLVAINVMGYEQNGELNDWKLNEIGEGTAIGELPDFSTHDGDVQEVIKKLSAWVFLTDMPEVDHNAHRGEISKVTVTLKTPERTYKVVGDTFAHAVCLAALEAVAFEIEL
jgi:hypothetical protein